MADKTRLPSFPQRGQLPQVQVFELPDDAPKLLKDWIGKVRFTEQMVRWFGLIKPAITESEGEPQFPAVDGVVVGTAVAEAALIAEPQRPGTDGPRDAVMSQSAMQAALVARVMAEVVGLIPAPRYDWLSYLMRQAGGIVKLEGESASFPGLRRSPATPADTQSVLADGSALTGHEVLDEAYGSGWNGKIEVPTKNAVYDKIQLLLGSSAYTPTNVTPDRSYDATATTLLEIANVLGTLIADLQSKGILS